MMVAQPIINADLFAPIESERREVALAAGAVLLGGFLHEHDVLLLEAIDAVLAQAPLRHMTTSRGLRMSVAMSNCGSLGWISDRRGYRYTSVDPETDKPWPDLPDLFSELAASAAARAGFANFRPDACLINRYEPGSRMALHQDRDERDFNAPIVSVSLGMSAIFLFGGNARADRALSVPLIHGDVVVWGGPARLRFHGVRPLKDDAHALTGRYRFNLTLRKAG